MTERSETPSPATVAALAEDLGLALEGDDRDRLASAVADGLSGYDSLGAGTPDSPEPDRPPLGGVDRDPDDEYDAFLARFDLDGGDGPLDGTTVALKDNIAVAGAPMTCGAAPFAGAVPERDAAVVGRLLEAGASLVGKANMDELAYGPTGETSAFGAAENPAAPGHVTGGSSSGSAAAVAGGLADAALGTDTGGSVRIPASFCGLVGFKPTWGAVPTEGVVELAYSLDHVGPLAPDVSTAARVLDAVADAGAGAGRFAEAAADPPAVGSLTLGVPDAYFHDRVTDAVAETVRGRVDDLEDAGATVREVSLPALGDAVPVWNAVVNVEFATALAAGLAPLLRRGRADAAWHRDALAGMEEATFGPVVRRKAVEGAYLVRERGAADYVAARNRRADLAEAYESALDGLDALVTPTMPTGPVEVGAWDPEGYASGDGPPPLAVNTRPADLAGVPALSVPAGGPTERPVGVQFLGAAGADARVLAVGAAFEAVRDGG